MSQNKFKETFILCVTPLLSKNKFTHKETFILLKSLFFSGLHKEKYISTNMQNLKVGIHQFNSVKRKCTIGILKNVHAQVSFLHSHNRRMFLT